MFPGRRCSLSVHSHRLSVTPDRWLLFHILPPPAATALFSDAQTSERVCSSILWYECSYLLPLRCHVSPRSFAIHSHALSVLSVNTAGSVRCISTIVRSNG